LLSADEVSELFERKANTMPKPNKPKKSLLSEQLEKFPTLPNNPFSEFAKFDGSAYAGIPTKKLRIYLTMLMDDDRNFPMTVVTIITAKVQELIGLICWQYTNENRQPELKDNIDNYSLCIAEETGEVDLDFPSLDPKEAISKFGFTDLALVEKNVSDNPNDDQIVVKVNIPHQGGFSLIPVDSTDVAMKEVLESTLRRRGGILKAKGLEYQLEKENEPGVSIDLEASLGTMGTSEFCLVRANSRRVKDTLESWQPEAMLVMEAPRYQSYRVTLIGKLLNKTDIHLGISGEKIEIDPVQKGGVKFWTQPQKAVTHDIETIAACEQLEQKFTGGKAMFKLTYRNHNSHDFKHHNFEAERNEAKEIVDKITHILELKMSPLRRDFLAMKERRQQRRMSLQLSGKISSRH